jgi:asparagine synthetase B (glutamine-hydrolysing)
MCGFVGIFDAENFQGKHSTFMDFAMKDLYRRGPDSQNTWKSDSEKLELGFSEVQFYVLMNRYHNYCFKRGLS